MGKLIDYYYALISPWSYLGGPRLERIARAAGAAVSYKPVELPKIFAATGGVPLAQRPPARKAYRLAELRRWRAYLDMALVLEPRYFPADETLAARTVIAAQQAGADGAGLTMAIQRAVWAEERNIADADAVRAIADENGMDGAALVAAADGEAVATAYAANTEEALARGVFGAPSYVYDGELYWGQDRLDFLARALGLDGAGRAAAH